MRRPSLGDLPAELATVASEVAERIAAAGARAWLVGGTVRDLALGEPVGDLDMASALEPAQAERLFERSHPVGRAFGSLLVPWRQTEVQLTTFRSEAGYTDGRRPSQVQFGATLEQDAARRDFTCNALFLDPRNDELRDPQAGLADMERGLLRAVGEPSERFLEDRLRLLRLARFRAKLNFRVEARTWEGARAMRGDLQGVSAERVRDELERILTGPRAVLALRTLAELDLLRWRRGDGGDWEDVLRLVERLRPSSPTSAALEAWAAFLDPTQPLEELRFSRERIAGLREAWRLADVLAGSPSRAERVRAARSPHFASALALARARALASNGGAAALESLAREASAWSAAELWPAPLIAAQDLAQLGIARGPSWGQCLKEAETLQLDGRLQSRAEALQWLQRRAAELALGPQGESPT
jgi:tRNA nucleotidyltransferase/poly(A) polymerase